MFPHVVRLAEFSDISATEEFLRKEKDGVYVYYSFNWALFHGLEKIITLANAVITDFPNKSFSQMEVEFTTIRDGEAPATVTLIKIRVSADEFIKLRKKHLIHSLR